MGVLVNSHLVFPPLVNLLTFGFRITGAGEYNPTVTFFSFSFIVTSVSPLLFGFFPSCGSSKVTNSLAFFPHSEFFNFCYYQNLAGFDEHVEFPRCPSAEENFSNINKVNLRAEHETIL